MANYYVRKHDTEKVVSNLTVSDLKEMAQAGQLAPNDEIRKNGRTTWHRASTVNGLVFCEPSTAASTPESHTESVHHDDEAHNVESETIAEISEQISTHAKVRREKTPWAKGWFRRFIVKSVSSIVIIAMVIVLGSWGVWTVLSDSQKELVTNKYESIKNYFEEDASESVVATGSGSVVNSSQTIANINAGSTSMTSTGKMQVIAHISVPEFGPLWVHEELRLPVLGSYFATSNTGYNSRGDAWIQLFLATPRSPIEGTLEIKSFYSADQFGKPKWFQVSKSDNNNSVFPIAGAGDWYADGANPSISSDSIELLRLATTLGIANQANNHSALVIGWFDLKQDYLQPSIESHIEDSASGNIDRVSFINDNSLIKFLQFDRDTNQRVVAVNAYDERGTLLGQMFKFDYAVDNTLSQIATLEGKDTWTAWTPAYNNGALTSLEGVRLSKTNGSSRYDCNYRVYYEYDFTGRIANIIYTKTRIEINSWDPKHIRIVTNERVLTTSFAYKNSDDYWSAATVSGITTETTVRGTDAPEKVTKHLGTVRFEQALYTTVQE